MRYCLLIVVECGGILLVSPWLHELRIWVIVRSMLAIWPRRFYEGPFLLIVILGRKLEPIHAPVEGGR